MLLNVHHRAGDPGERERTSCGSHETPTSPQETPNDDTDVKTRAFAVMFGIDFGKKK